MNQEKDYRHGGFRQADFGLPGSGGGGQVLDFSVNLNPLGPPSAIREQWSGLFEAIREYPSVSGEGVALYYERRYGIPPDHFLAGNGSTEMIYLIPKALGIRKSLVIVPSFHDYSRASRVAGAKVMQQFLLREDQSFVLKEDEVLAPMREADALWLGNPNNPTGNLYPRDFIVKLCRDFPGKWIIVDEAFISFVEGSERFSMLRAERPKNLLILHSLTKFYSLAGIRMGGVVATPEVILRLKAFKEPWTVNSIAERIAPLLLNCGDFEEKTISLMSAERRRMLGSLRDMKLILALEPTANFILCQWRTTNLDDLMRHLFSRGIYVRDCRNFPGLEDNWFRVAVLLPEQNERLLSAISSFPLS